MLGDNNQTNEEGENGPLTDPNNSQRTAVRDRILPYSMRTHPAISVTPFLKRFRRGRPDRGRRPSR